MRQSSGSGKFASPFSTGGGGSDFERLVGAYYLSTILLQGVPRGRKAGIACETQFQRCFAGEPLDDLIVFSNLNGVKVKLSIQIKHDLTFGNKNEIFNEVMQACWETFNAAEFRQGVDLFGIAIGLYSKNVAEHYERALTWARDSASAKDFLLRIEQRHLSHQAQREFVELIKNKLRLFHPPNVNDEQLWNFLRSMVILHFDFRETGSRDYSDVVWRLQTLLPPEKIEDAPRLFTQLCDYAATANMTAGSLDANSLRQKLLADGFDLLPLPWNGASLDYKVRTMDLDRLMAAAEAQSSEINASVIAERHKHSTQGSITPVFHIRSSESDHEYAIRRGPNQLDPGVREPQAINYISEGTITGSAILSQSLPPPPGNIVPLPTPDFIGRQSLLEEILAEVDKLRVIALIGLFGIGKTATLCEIAARLNPATVFWYEFREGLSSLQDVLTRLMRFLYGRSEPSTDLAVSLQWNERLLTEKIDLLTELLNQNDHHLFFDNVHLVEKDEALMSFFSLLKEKMHRGSVLMAAISKPTFITAADEIKGLGRAIFLEGLGEVEVRELLKRKNITVTEGAARKIQSNIDGLPLALELLLALASEQCSEQDLLGYLSEVKQQIVESLFESAYRKLDYNERSLLTTASLFNLPFHKDLLLESHLALSGHNCRSELNSLHRRSLLRRYTKDSYQVLEVVGSLAITYAEDDIDSRRIGLAKYLYENKSDDLESCLNAMLLSLDARDYERAAEMISEGLDRGMLPYYPELSELLVNRLKEDLISTQRLIWLLGDKGRIADFWRRYDDAEKHYQRMLELAKKDGDKVAQAAALLRLGVVYHDRNNKTSESYYLDSLTLKEELGDLNGQAEIHNNLGLIYENRGDYDRARQMFDRGMELREGIKSPDWQKLSLYANLGILYARRCDWEQAFAYSGKALRIAEETQSPYEIARCKFNIAHHEADRGNLGAARVGYEEALVIADNYDLWELKELAFAALGRLEGNQGNYDAAIGWFKHLAEINEEIGDQAKLCSILFDIGTFHIKKEAFTEALRYYIKGISYFECVTDEESIDLHLANVCLLAVKAEESEVPGELVRALKALRRKLSRSPVSYLLAATYATLGRLYLEIFNYERVGLHHMRYEAETLAKLGRDKERVHCLMNLAVRQQEVSRHGEALITNREALRVAKEHDFDDLVGKILYNTANCHAEVEMYEEAVDCYLRAREIARRTSNQELQKLITHNLGEVYRRQGEIEAGIELLTSSVKLAHANGDVAGEIAALNNLGLAYGEISNTVEALSRFNQALALCQTHSLRKEEANTLISLGNHFLTDNPAISKEYYSQALLAARAAQDIDLEEGSMASLALACRKLGEYKEIADELKDIAARAERLHHHEKLVKLLTIAGLIELDGGDVDSSVEMFEKALLFSWFLASKSIEQFLMESQQPFHFIEFSYVIGRILDEFDRLIAGNEREKASDLFERLIRKIKTTNHLEENSLMLAHLLPIGQYLRGSCDEPFIQYVTRRWSELDASA